MSRVLIANKEVANADWNQHLPHPLIEGEKVIKTKDQDGVSEDYVRVQHAKGRAKSIFNIKHFT